MEIIPEGRNFRLLHDDELPTLLNVLEKHLPYSLKFHQTIKTYLNHRIWHFHFYVSKSWPDDEICLHFPGCTLTPNNQTYESFGIFCPLDKLDAIDLLRSEDVLIDWSMPLYLNYTHVNIVERIEDFLRGIGSVEHIQGEVYVWNKPGKPDLSLGELPANEVEMRLLKEEDVKSIHDLYPASEIESIEVFEKLSGSLPGYGIFTIEGELAAWMIQSYYGAMFSMQTKPQHRRKGYGIYLAQNLTRLVIKRGYKPFVVIRHENDASKSLYTKLGFVREFEMARIVWRPYGYVREDAEAILNAVNDDKKIDMSDSYKNGNHKIREKTNGVHHEG